MIGLTMRKAKSKTLMAKLYWCCAFLILAATAARAETASATDTAVERGRYLARAGDCGACHTAPGGKEFAGGLPMPTPLGRIYTTNITPDPETGIGAYNLEDFSRALREGVAKDGHYLYPAMPFPAFGKIDDADIASLYAYFLHGVEPVKQANRASDIPILLNFRFPLYFWGLVRPPRAVSARSCAGRAMEPRRLSGAGSRPLRHLPFAAQPHPSYQGADGTRGTGVSGGRGHR